MLIINNYDNKKVEKHFNSANLHQDNQTDKC